MYPILQSYVKEQLEEHRKSDAEQYLKNLYDLYTRYLYISDEIIGLKLLENRDFLLRKRSQKCKLLIKAEISLCLLTFTVMAFLRKNLNGHYYFQWVLLWSSRVILKLCKSPTHLTGNLIAVVLCVIKHELCEILYLNEKLLQVLITIRVLLCCVLYKHVML